VKAGGHTDHGNTQLQKTKRMKRKQRKVCIRAFKW